ncbi:Putative uncharacterized protein [Taphrina deformans PYCC 5710]|uniref:PABS domain-containing protein n=1 Tax=Taphrina deformans (strain PYCC 5710 / ATCC 11124 / CBS 356.35 / IMI 108563 / JCM 9778 / NBRC 8474) TaxID=1097556 RepID=R4X7K9_TAPDE|nr:Putative uncharacterized protein [Taphrina deformans PYCC 5710]|eukprot:CCG81113.1 Putative uncharacterized protein [Taphrina deformans PYCC 5710]
MHRRVRSREVERDVSHLNDDFASAGPLELFVLALLTSAFSYLYLAVPKLSAQIYGESATHVYRPTIPLLLLGAVFAAYPARRESSLPYILLGVSCTAWSLFLKYAQVYFGIDAAIIRSLLDTYGSTLYQLGYQGHIGTNVLNDRLKLWTPVIASSVIDAIFMMPLTLVMVSMLRQRSRKTQLPAFVTLAVLLIVGLVVCTMLNSLKTIGASDIFQLVPLIAVLALLSSRTYKAVLANVLCCVIISWVLQATRTFSCDKLPHILLCATEVGGFQVLASAESVTGRISVIENDKYRLLKADHSLLGGEWMTDGAGQSIFTAFYMQSLAVHAFSPARSSLNVLQIGLGIGTATKSMLKSPLFEPPSSTLIIDVVELDPKVVEYAYRFFELPATISEPRLKVHVMDVQQFLVGTQNGTYDLISHDVFSGGSLAYSLFTVQFFKELKVKLSRGGILTVNFVYAPKIAQINLDSITHTLRHVFKHVVAYVESGRVEEINNMVFLCSDAEMWLNIPEAVKSPHNSLGQTARNMKSWRYDDLPLPTLDDSLVLQDESVDFGTSRAIIRKGERAMALSHWRLMRNLLPPPENEIWTSF